MIIEILKNELKSGKKGHQDDKTMSIRQIEALISYS